MKITPSHLALTASILFGITQAKPVFNSVNKYDANGNPCPLRTRSGQLCPQLCVTNIDLCPKGFGQDTCDSGQQLCKDGKCHSSCSGILPHHNPCRCGFQYPPSESSNLSPCVAFPDVTIDHYNPDSDQSTIDFCVDKFNISDSNRIAKWGDWASSNDNENDGYWVGGMCPKAPSYHYTYHEPMWLAVFACCGTEALILLTWLGYKWLRERKIRSLRHSESGFSTAEAAKATNLLDDEKEKKGSDSGSSKSIGEKEKGEESSKAGGMQLKGFKNDPLGWVGFGSVLTVSLGWFVWLGFWTGDYYGTLGEPYTLSLYNSALLDETMIPIWIFTTTWVVVCCNFQKRLRNAFRIECLPSRGSYVQVERELDILEMAGSTNRLVQFAKGAEALFRRVVRSNVHVETCPIKRTGHTQQKYFNYMCTRYVLNEETGQYSPWHFDLGSTHSQLRTHQGGLSTDEAAARTEVIGPNFIGVRVDGYAVSFAKEMAEFFYLYQFMVMWLYYYWNYYVIGIIDTAIILFSAAVKVVVRVNGERRIKRMAEQRDDSTILRDGEWKRLSTIDLVPGDVFRVEAGQHVACDAIVLGGNIVVDESSLTGEPLPVRKFPIGDSEAGYEAAGSGKANTLFAGTSVSQAAGDDCMALCMRTGTQTDKGQLVQEMLFPQPVSFVFDEQLRVVFGILIAYAVVVFVLAMVFYQTQPSASWFYAMFSCSQLISPLIPAALVMGQSVAAGRLKKKQIYCVNLSRIVMAGKVQVFCFDKTGTLTKEGLEMDGALCPTPDNTFAGFSKGYASLPELMKTASSTCHAVTEVGDSGQRIGNPVDIELFRATQCTLDLTPSSESLDTVVTPDNIRLDIVRRFEFQHARASMSVAVRDPRDGHIHVFVKGSFEKVRERLDPRTVPGDYGAAANALARRGGYVLAVGHRDLGPETAALMAELELTARDQLEDQCQLIGLLVFRNMLKPDTPAAIARLKEGNTRTVMITGDTALTGVFIARAAGLMQPDTRCYLAEVSVSSDGQQQQQLTWTDVDRDELVPQAEVEQGLDAGTAELAMTGHAFNRMAEQGTLRQYLLRTRVFARMLPADKVNCIRLHMEKAMTAMCGDGGNDCGALRAAHVGLALSDAEASIVSPFSSGDRSIHSCVELLLQGRAALSTSFAAYLYLILYGQTMTFLKICYFYFSITASMNTWIWIDAFINTLMSICVAYSGPAKRLSPYRPTARILGPQVLTTALGTVAIDIVFVASSMAWLFTKSWFRCNEFDSSTTDIAKWWLLGDNYEAEVLTIVALFQFVNNAMVVNFGYYFRRRWYRNYALIFLWAVYVSLVSAVLLAPTNWLGCRFRFNCGTKEVLASKFGLHPSFYIEPYNSIIGHNVIPKRDRYELWGLCIGNMCATVLWQLVVALYPVHSLTRKKRPLRRLKVIL